VGGSRQGGHGVIVRTKSGPLAPKYGNLFEAGGGGSGLKHLLLFSHDVDPEILDLHA
jgi:hypothetical protein